MEYNKKLHWIDQMTPGETVYIDYMETKRTGKGNLYIIAQYQNDIIYANINPKDETLFEPGNTYSMTCTECKYNTFTKHNYLQYKFEKVLSTTSDRTDEKPVSLQDNLSDYFEDEDCELALVELEKLRTDYQKRLSLIDYCIHKLNK